uniref:NB-ARC domain-containing protein n=1 Tax=Leersia perrieri TaxID=77586 RepID=A0A0D9V1L5_9ORYZ
MASGLVPSLLSSTSSLLAILRRPLSALYPSSNPTASANLQRLKRLLSRIQATLDDAEEQAIQDNYVKLWLKELKDLAHDAEDVLDDYRYELLQCHVQERQADYPRKRKHMDYYDEDDDSIIERINEITTRFEEISRDRAALQLRSEDGQKIADRGDWLNSQPTSHLLDESTVFGRIDDKENIVQSVLSQGMEQGIAVLPIVGMGGIGKTTVAQMVYNDGRVRKHFDHCVWIHVSPTFDVLRLTTAITESLTKKNCGFIQLSLVHEILQHELDGKKLFLVLDDLWNECGNYWEALLCPFGYAQTVTILVTTRSKEVARVVQTVQLFVLGCITDSDCWLLFQHYAFGNQHENKQSRFVQIGRAILKKCAGLPLAVKSIGCLLRSKRDVHTWMEILESELWELDGKEDIFPALRLSYHRLPTRLKPCFLLCSLYPTYLGFTKDEVVGLWIAQGYVDATGGKKLQEVGNEYFNELCARSLIEISSGQLLDEVQYFDDLTGKSSIESFYKESKNERSVRPSNPLQSFTSMRTRKYNAMKQTLIETYLEKSSKSVQRFKLHDVMFDLAKSFTRDERCMALLKILCNVPNKLHQLHASQSCGILSFHEPRSLRTLVLNCCFSACFNELSSFVYLRALVLNSNQDISNLVCSIGNLKYLRYLSLNCYLLELPLSISSLYCLETLVISKLRTLRATNFYNLVSLNSLDVSFDLVDGSLDQFCELGMLGTLCLKRCSNMTYLPVHIGSLFNLHHLQLIGIPNLRNLLGDASSKYRKSNSITRHSEAKFPSLEELELKDLCKLEDWYGMQHSDYPKLQSLTIRNCSKLRTVPSFVSLRKLVTRKMQISDVRLITEYGVDNFRTVEHLIIEKCSEISQNMLSSTNSWLPSTLRFLQFSSDTFSGVLNFHKGLSMLGRLEIRNCSIERLKLIRCPLLQLRELMPAVPETSVICCCPRLKKWCEWHGIEYKDNLEDSYWML